MKKCCERIREMTTAVMKEAKLTGEENLSGLVRSSERKKLGPLLLIFLEEGFASSAVLKIILYDWIGSLLEWL